LVLPIKDIIQKTTQKSETLTGGQSDKKHSQKNRKHSKDKEIF
jgi:hypothetical protein